MRNESIYNKTQKSSLKNFAVIEQDRENKIKNYANQSFINEIKRRNKIFDEINFKKKQENFDLQEAHQKQISDKIFKKNQNKSIELVEDKIMIENFKNHENEVIEKENYEEIQRRTLCRKNLDDQKFSNMLMENINDTKEFELNKSILKKLSP